MSRCGRGCVKTLGAFANRAKRAKNSKRDSNLRDLKGLNFAELIYSEVGFCFYTASAKIGHSAD